MRQDTPAVNLFIIFALHIALIVNVKRINAQSQYWQQQVDYNIKGYFDKKNKTLTAHETIIYHNNILMQ